MLRLNDIQIRRSPVVGVGDFVLEIDCRTQFGDLKFSGYFDDFGGFLTAVKDAAAFYLARMGRVDPKQASAILTTRDLASNPDSSVR